MGPVIFEKEKKVIFTLLYLYIINYFSHIMFSVLRCIYFKLLLVILFYRILSFFFYYSVYFMYFVSIFLFSTSTYHASLYYLSIRVKKFELILMNDWNYHFVKMRHFQLTKLFPLLNDFQKFDKSPNLYLLFFFCKASFLMQWTRT